MQFCFNVHLRHSEDIPYVKKLITVYVFFMGSFYFHNPANDPYGKNPKPPPKRKLGFAPPPHMLACPEVEIKIALFFM
jgi:hypothetical protein